MAPEAPAMNLAPPAPEQLASPSPTSGYALAWGTWDGFRQFVSRSRFTASDKAPGAESAEAPGTCPYDSSTQEVAATELRIMDVMDAAEEQWKVQPSQLCESLHEAKESAAAALCEHSRDFACLRQVQLEKEVKEATRREAEQAQRAADLQELLAAQSERLATMDRLSRKVCKSLYKAQESAAAASREHSLELACLQSRLGKTQAQLEEQVDAAARREAEQAGLATGLQELLVERSELLDAAEAQWKGQLSQLRELLHEAKENTAAASREHSRELACLRARLEESQAQLKEQVESAACREAEQARRAAGLEERLAKRSHELREMREHLREKASRGVCCICLDAPSNVVLLPCRHKHTCGSCAANIACCPICRVAVQERLEVFE